TTSLPASSIPQVTGEVWSPPEPRRVMRTAWWRGRRKSTSPARSGRSAVAYFVMRPGYGWPLLVDHRHGRVIGPAHVVGARPVHPVLHRAVDEPVGHHVVVDAPARVVVERLPALGPPRVRSHLVGAPVPDDVRPAAAVGEHPGHPLALVRQESRTLVVALVVLQVLLAVGDVPVPADDHLVPVTLRHVGGALAEELPERRQEAVLLVLLGRVGRTRRQIQARHGHRLAVLRPRVSGFNVAAGLGE